MEQRPSMTAEERDWRRVLATPDVHRRRLRGLTRGLEILTDRQRQSIDALVARFGDAMIRVRAGGIAGVFHTEHPQEVAWLVSPDGDVAEYLAVGAPTFNISASEVAAW